MQFRDIIGQQAVKSQLVNLVHHNRLGHALLFLGKEGSGALPLALAFAQYIVCISSKLSGTNEPTLFGDITPKPQEDVSHMTDSCGSCPACIKANQLIHPDIHFSFPVITKKSGEVPISADYIIKWREFVSNYPYGNVYDWLQFIAAENKQGNITTRECEDINHKISLKSFESRYKILIMWMPEFLGKEGNKLLKLIEEPPPDTVFIFVAEDEDVILPTILSRTQLIKIPFLYNCEIVEALINEENVNESKAKQIAGICEGNYREALQMLQDAEEDWHSKVRDWLNAIVKTGPIAQVRWIEEMGKLGREKQKQFLKYFIHLLQNAVKLKVHEGNHLQNDQITNHVTEKDLDFIIRINKLCRLESLDAIISELEKATLYIERNANAKMLFHALTIRVYHIIKDNSLILV
jgi:DNA polymerase-3 subunit delta'